MLTDYHYVICSRYLTTHLLLVIYELQFTIDHDSGCETLGLLTIITTSAVGISLHTSYWSYMSYSLPLIMTVAVNYKAYYLYDICSRYLTTHLLLDIYELQFTIDHVGCCESLGLLTIITTSAVGISLLTAYWSYMSYSLPLIMTVTVKLQAYYLYDICSRYLTTHLLLVIYELQFTIDHDSGCDTLGLLTIITTSAAGISLLTSYWSYMSYSLPLILTVAVKL